MKNITVQIFLLIFLFQSCTSFKTKLSKEGDINDAINNAIIDFSNTSNLYKKGTVFYISPKLPLHKMILEKVDEKNAKWVESTPYQNLLGISISESKNKIFLPKDLKLGSKGKLPSRYIEKDGKLFYWWDNNYSLKKDALDIFNKYNILETDRASALDLSTDDNKKSMHYYFCIDNLMKYKKVKTSKGLGYYVPPKLNCR